MSSRLRLSLYWFVATAALGVYFPYFSLYLREALSFTGVQIGMAFSVAPLMGVVAQPLWGVIADRTGSRRQVLALLCAGTATGYALLTQPRSFVWLLAALGFLAFFSTAQVPMAVAVSLATHERDGRRIPFGQVRVWGTLGFGVTVLGIPALLGLVQQAQQQGERQVFHLVFALAALLAGLAALLALAVPRVPSSAEARSLPGDQRFLRQQRPYLRVLCVNFLAYVCLQGPMMLFPVYVRARGGTTATVSYMWLCMLSLETLLMIWAAPLYKWLGAKAAITCGVLACSLRWLLCGLSDDLRWVYPLQMLHGVMVVSLQVAGPLLVESLVPDRLRASSQAGYNLWGSGLGGIVSTTLAGVVLDAWGMDTVMVVFGCAGLALSAVVPWLLPAEPVAGGDQGHGIRGLRATDEAAGPAEATHS